MIPSFSPQQLRSRVRSSACALVLLLGAVGQRAQGQVSQYTFTASQGVWSPFSDGTALVSGSFLHEVYVVQLPTPFWFDGNYHSTIYVSSNGFITLGSAAAINNTQPISSSASYAGAIAPFGTDLRSIAASTAPRDIRWKRVGDDLIVQWRGLRRNLSNNAENIGFQVRLNLVNGLIRFVYGGVSSLSNNVTIFPEVGLRGPDTNALNRINRTVGTGAETWASSLAGTTPAQKMRFTSAAPAKSPANGLTCTWTPYCEPVYVDYTSVTSDCANSQFSVHVHISALGTAPSVDITSSVGGTLFDNVGLGSYVCGPFPSSGPVTLSIVHNGAPLCSGTIGTFSAQNCVTNGSCIAPPISIPNYGCAANNNLEVEIALSGLPSTLGTATHQAVLTSVDLIILHTSRSQLNVSLRSPSGQLRSMILGRAGFGDNFGSAVNCPQGVFTLKDAGTPLAGLAGNGVSNLTGGYAPEESLSGFTGDPNGVWKLIICDDHIADYGSLKYVRLNIQEVDCVGVPGGQAFEGSPCNDGSACTTGDVYNQSCTCVGVFQDSDNDGTCDANDLCPGNPEPGQPCDDGDDNTGDDVVKSDCSCVGQPLDCLGVIGGGALPGTLCDDGNPNTQNDAWTAACNCVGSGVGQTVSLTLTTDANGAQTSWEVIPEGGGTPLCSGSGYSSNSVVTVYCPLTDGCYSLRVMDSAGDGLTTGGYVLRDVHGDRIIDNEDDGQDFTSLSAVANGAGFCLPLGADHVKDSRCDLENLLPSSWIGAQVNQAVSAEWGVGDQTNDGYQFWFFNPDGGYSRRVLVTHATGSYIFPVGPERCSYLRFADIVTSPLPHDVLLNVRVRSMVNGTYSAFGHACRMKIDLTPLNCPTTQLVADPGDPHFSCGKTNVLLNSSQHLWAQYVSAATTYQFRFYDPLSGNGRLVTSAGSSLLMSEWSTNPLHYATMYAVTVRVSFDNGVNYCAWGTECTITTAAAPPTAPRSLEAAPGTAQPMQLWPVPNNGSVLNLVADGFSTDATQATMEIFTMDGRLALRSAIPVNEGSVRYLFELRQRLTTDVYMVVLRSGTDQRMQRLIIE
jgi:hypothetical protein